jgi:hypothetical protein
MNAPLEPAEIREYLVELRKAEDQFYRTVLNETELYVLAIRLVRAIADSLAPIADLGALIERYQRSDSEYVVPIADTLEAPRVMVLDYQLALAAAFYLRAQEIQQQTSQADFQRRLAAARAEGRPWAVIFDHEQKRYGKTFFRRLEVRVADGLSLYTGSELDMEKGLIYTFEPMWLDADSGKPRQGVALPQPRQDFATREALLAAAAAFRQGNP